MKAREQGNTEGCRPRSRTFRRALRALVWCGLLLAAQRGHLLAPVHDAPREDANDWRCMLGAMHCVAHQTHPASDRARRRLNLDVESKHGEHRAAPKDRVTGTDRYSPSEGVTLEGLVGNRG